MPERRKRASDKSPRERLEAIEERQSRLLDELDALNERVESALSAAAEDKEPAP